MPGTPALPDGCPPADAAPSEGTFYRLVRGSRRVGDPTIADEDWLLPHEKRKGECVGASSRCECHAHSIFSDLADIESARETSEWVRKKAVAAVNMEPDMGVLKQAPTDLGDSHHEWWPADPTDAPWGEVVMAGAPKASP